MDTVCSVSSSRKVLAEPPGPMSGRSNSSRQRGSYGWRRAVLPVRVGRDSFYRLLVALQMREVEFAGLWAWGVRKKEVCQVSFGIGCFW